MNYYADYLDFSFSYKINKQKILDLENRFKFDLLSVYPGKIVFTLTAALMEESSSILMKYKHFWINNKLGITFAKKYTSATSYINDRMDILNKGVHNLVQNYEYKIYTSKNTNVFINYLTSDLSMRGSGIVNQLKKLNRMPIIMVWHTVLIIGNVRQGIKIPGIPSRNWKKPSRYRP